MSIQRSDGSWECCKCGKHETHHEFDTLACTECVSLSEKLNDFILDSE